MKRYLFFLFFLTSSAWSADRSFSWNANAELDLAGYRLYWGAASRNYSSSVNVGNQTSYTVTGLTEGATYYVAVTASDISGNESTFSSELTVLIPLPPQNPTLWSINFQPGNVVNPAGYVTDSGQVYTTARKYGWDVANLGLRERGINVDKRLDTFVYTGTSSIWQADVANGPYLVSLATGDAGYPQGPHRVVVEGTTLVNNLNTSANQFVTVVDAPITIADGKLTLVLGGTSGNSMLNYIVIKSAGGSPPPTPVVVTISKNVSRCTFTLSANAPDSASGWTAQFFQGTSAVGSPDSIAPYSQDVELPLGTYQFSATFSKAGQPPVSSVAAVAGVCP